MTGGPLTVLTGVNRPSAPTSGGMVLVGDLYRAMPATRTVFLGRTPAAQQWVAAFDQLITLSTVKCPLGRAYDAYVEELTDEVRALIEEVRPDAIHAQYPGLALSLALTRAAVRIPVVSIAHGPDVIAAERSADERARLEEVAAASAAIVAPTPALADRLDRLTRHRFTDRLTVIPWGIPLERARARDRPPHRSGPLSLVHAGRLDDNKSTVTVIEALALAGQRHRLTVIGEGSLRGDLERRARALGLRDRVVFEPFLPRGELWSRLPGFDAFVFTTKGIEAFGLVLIEAQAHALPVAYSDLPGVRETLGGAGLPYVPGDPHSLARALDELGQDTGLRAALAEAAVKNARRYDIATTGRRLQELTLRLTPLNPEAATAAPIMIR
ncbi:glycosyltransferase family 4 protein [Kitasatospora sp. NPDC002040]|uniref:glycosyltransferase family 4 protein n=1 Tax=Kitasatospora sp. NPDC002040 TaxID=3154661 RepID=UPI00331ECB13